MISETIQNLIVGLLVIYSDINKHKSVKAARNAVLLILYLFIQIPVYLFITDSFNEQYAHSTIQIMVTTLLIFFSIFLAIYPRKEIELDILLHGSLGETYEQKIRKITPKVKRHVPKVTIENKQKAHEDDIENPLKPFSDEIKKFLCIAVNIFLIALFIIVLMVFFAFFGGLYALSIDAFFFAYFYSLLFYILIVLWMVYTIIDVHFKYALMAYIIPNKLLREDVIKPILIIADVFVDYDEGIIGKYAQNRMNKAGVRRKGKKRYEFNGEEARRVRL